MVLRQFDNLHDQSDREPAQPGPQDDPQQGTFPERRGCNQADLPGAAADRGELAEATEGVASHQVTTGDTIR